MLIVWRPLGAKESMVTEVLNWTSRLLLRFCRLNLRRSLVAFCLDGGKVLINGEDDMLCVYINAFAKYPDALLILVPSS